MKKTFLNGNKPLVAMIQCRTAEECINKIKLSLKDGAEALGVQLCQLKPEERTREKLKSVFDACEDKPIYVTSYRYNLSDGLTDTECADLLLLALECGATLCDVMGDMFDKNDTQITKNESAVKKQRELIEKIHNRGGEVLISTHDFRDLSEEEIFNVAKLQAEHGADIIKIVVTSESEERLPDYIKAVNRINDEIKKPVLFLDTGACSNILRKVGGFLGSCMYLCVQSHGKLDTLVQPKLNKLMLIRDNMMEKQL